MGSSSKGAAADRRGDDAYETPGWCVDRLLDVVKLPAGRWLEPCSGSGNIIRAVNARPEYAGLVDWTGVEIRRECFPALGLTLTESLTRHVPRHALHHADFLHWVTTQRAGSFDVVITNPPFFLAMPFILASLRLAPVVVMLLRLNYITTADRHAFMSAQRPDGYPLPNRPSFTEGGTSSDDYAWYVFEGILHQGTMSEPVYQGGIWRVLGLTPLEIRRPAKHA